MSLATEEVMNGIMGNHASAIDEHHMSSQSTSGLDFTKPELATDSGDNGHCLNETREEDTSFIKTIPTEPAMTDTTATPTLSNGTGLETTPLTHDSADDATSKDSTLHSDRSSLLAAISNLEQEARSFAQKSGADKATRYEIRTAALALADSLESPVEQALRIVFETAPPTVALRIALEAGFLEPLANGESKSAETLSTQSKAETALIARIMRVLVASKIVDEVGVNTYAANGLTHAFLQPGIADAVRHGCDIVNIIFARLPEYLANIEFRDPDSYNMGPHVFVFGKPLWKHLEMEPQRSRIFDKVMMAFKRNRETFVDIFPFEKRVGTPCTPDQTLVVDVAGGIGHRLKDFRTKFGGMPGRAVLQDLAHVLPTQESNPEVLAGLLNCGIELMEHDIFTPQPIQGARYYFFSAIFHGRPDKACLELLRNTAPAMNRDSRILINDFVLPDQGANLFQASFDLWMMADVTGKERTLTEWNTLVETANLRLVEVHRLGMDSVLEIALPE